MKVKQKALNWIIPSIIIQIVILLFLNNFYLNRDETPVVASIYIETERLKIPPGASNLKVSFDGKYVGYLLDGKLKVLSLDSKKNVFIKNSEDTYSFFKWLPDRDMLILSKQNTAITPNFLEIRTFDVITGVERSYPQIKNLSSKSQVIGIELSTLTNVVYIEVKINNYEKDIYKFDIMDNLDYIMTVKLSTIIKQMNFVDTVVYQENPKYILIRNGSSNWLEKIFLKKDYVLLGTDYEDNIYIGELDEEKNVKNILSKNLQGGTEKDWKQIPLIKTSAPKSIYIAAQGDVFCLRENSIYIANKNKEISFSGRCVDILNNYFITLNYNELQIYRL
jgi:hypothetical protein